MILWMTPLLLACSGNDPEGEGSEVAQPHVSLDAIDQSLPVGFVGERYDTSLKVGGGTPPYEWTVVDGFRLPGGLSFGPDGELAGIPTEAGQHEVPVVVADSAGRDKRVRLTIPIVLEPRPVACGETIGGTFDGNGFTFGGPDLDDLRNLEWLTVTLPDDLTQRIELVFDMPGSLVSYVQRPFEQLGSWNIEDHYVPTFVSPTLGESTVTVDPGTNPSLTGFASAGRIPVLLVAQSGGPWEMTVVCTDGPVFERVAQWPVEIGTELSIDYDVWGPDAGVRIYTPDPLPEWMVWNEETGEVTGIAVEAGAWEFDVIAETEDGRMRQERSIIGVYDVIETACDTTTPVPTTEGYFDGEFTTYWDPRGYSVARVPLAGLSPSQLTFRLSGTNANYVGIADPAPGWLKFYAGADGELGSGAPAQIDVTARTYPAVHHYLDDEQIYVISAHTGAGPGSLALEVECDDAPRPDMAGLPVVQPLVTADFGLPATGGVPPYLFTATGLPDGLSIREDRLIGVTSEQGAHPLQLTVEDSVGASTDALYTLYVGTEAACAGAEAIACDDVKSGTFTTTYFSDDNGSGSTRVFCLIPEPGQSLGFDVSSTDGEIRVDVADPGGVRLDAFDGARSTFVALVERDSSEGIALNPWSWPDLDDYDHLPLFVAVRAFNAGDWTVHLSCQ
ncbi:MAG: Ig domain-containing protein [Myxococcales bacterium]|nr:Ig domain-containing protein [Myxococcales bacterium]